MRLGLQSLTWPIEIGAHVTAAGIWIVDACGEYGVERTDFDFEIGDRVCVVGCDEYFHALFFVERIVSLVMRAPDVGVVAFKVDMQIFLIVP